MLEEAGTLGAHGVIGVVDRVSNVADTGTTEFHFLGTAVTVEGGPPPAGGVPWSTYLAGQRLTKSIEAGFMPVAVVAVPGLGPGLGLLHDRVLHGGHHGLGRRRRARSSSSR